MQTYKCIQIRTLWSSASGSGCPSDRSLCLISSNSSFSLFLSLSFNSSSFSLSLNRFCNALPLRETKREQDKNYRQGEIMYLNTTEYIGLTTVTYCKIINYNYLYFENFFKILQNKTLHYCYSTTLKCKYLHHLIGFVPVVFGIISVIIIILQELFQALSFFSLQGKTVL